MNDWPNLVGLPLWFWLFIAPTLGATACFFARNRAERILTPLWRYLDRLYTLGGMIASVFMVAILVLIVAQMIARWSNVAFPGSTEFAGYAMAATSFFALAHALMRGAHIRVSILLNLNTTINRWLDPFALLIAAVTATYFARYALKTTIFSEMLNDRTQGQDQIPETVLTILNMFNTAPWNWPDLWAASGSNWVYTPMWVPQIPMCIGTILLAIALWDSLYRLVITGNNPIKSEAIK
jgi:TRAP-type C4-dicarboxylate transport system permease small subunit